MDDTLQILKTWSHSQSFLIALTIAGFLVGRKLSELAGQSALLNPVITAICLISAFLIFAEVPYAEYSAATSPIQFLLNAAIVALAIPMFRQLRHIKDAVGPILISIAVGSGIAVYSALAILMALDASPMVLASMAPKSVTTPVAMLVAPQLGGVAALAAVFVILTGIIGYALGPWLLNRLKVTDPVARGLAYGTVSHIIGTSRAVRESDLSAACAGLAMSLNAVATAVLMPQLWRLFS